MTVSVRMLLSQATDLRNEGFTVFTADVNIAHMKDGDVVFEKTATRVAAGNTGSEQRNSDLETLEECLWPERSVPRRWQDHLEQILLWTHDETSITRIPRGRLVVGWNAPDHQGNPHSTERRPGAQEQRCDDETNALLGTNPGKKTKEGYNFGVHASYVESMLEEFNTCALKSSPTLRWERQEQHEKEMPASEQRVYRQLVGKLLWIDRADLRCAMGEASSSLERASDTDMRNIKPIL